MLHVLSLVSLQTTGKTVNNYSFTTIRSTQQKWNPLTPFENNGTLQKWDMTNTPPEIDKCDTHKKILSDKNDTPCKKLSRSYLSRTELSDF